MTKFQYGRRSLRNRGVRACRRLAAQSSGLRFGLFGFLPATDRAQRIGLAAPGDSVVGEQGDLLFVSSHCLCVAPKSVEEVGLAMPGSVILGIEGQSLRS